MDTEGLKAFAILVSIAMTAQVSTMITPFVKWYHPKAKQINEFIVVPSLIFASMVLNAIAKEFILQALAIYLPISFICVMYAVRWKGDQLIGWEKEEKRYARRKNNGDGV